MISALILTTVMMVPGAQNAINFTNVRLTYGELGPVRQDARYLPGDIFYIGFDIEGIKVEDDGTVNYSLGVEVLDKDNMSIFKQDPIKQSGFLPLGGSKLPARAFITIGIEQPPGKYTCKVTISDLATKATKTLEQQFEVLKKDFGIVVVYSSADENGAHAVAPLGVAGQAINLHFGIVGFARDPKTKRPSVSVQMTVIAKDGSATLQKPAVMTIEKEVNERDTSIPMRMLLPMNRVGDFTLELKATDQISKATTTIKYPIKVLSAN